jgi:hypothetical protein
MKTIIFSSLVLFFGCLNVNAQINWDLEYVNDRAFPISPEDYQLYPRNENNVSNVRLKGNLTSSYNKIRIRVQKADVNNAITTFYDQTYVLGSGYSFDITVSINSELSEYNFDYQLINSSGGTTAWKKIAYYVVCGDVYVLSGQSNATAPITESTDQLVYMTNYGPSSPYGRFSRTYGRPHPCSLSSWWIKDINGVGYSPGFLEKWGRSQITINGTIPDERNFDVGALGLYLQYLIQQNNKVPTCLINGSHGGRSINFFQPGSDLFDTLTNFGNLNAKIYYARVEHKIKGFLWYQGEGDATDMTTDYANRFVNLYKAWRRQFDFNKIYVFQIYGIMNPWEKRINEQIRSLVSFVSDIEIIATTGVGNQGDGENAVHFKPEGYKAIAKRAYDLIARDWYCEDNEFENLLSPNIINAYREGTKLTLEFDQQLSTSLSDPIGVARTIQLDNACSINLNITPSINGNEFVCYTTGSTYSTIMYPCLPYNGYNSPLCNNRGLGAYSFYVSVGSGAKYWSFLDIYDHIPDNPDYSTMAAYSQGIISGNVTTDFQNKEIFTRGTTSILSGSDIEFRAAEAIYLRSGFKANQGAYFKAIMDPNSSYYTDKDCYSGLKSTDYINYNQNDVYTYNELTDSIELIVYPNPNNGYLNIYFRNSEITQITNVTVNNVMGEMVYSDYFIQNKIYIDISFLPRGLYFVTISNNTIAKSIPIIRE